MLVLDASAAVELVLNRAAAATIQDTVLEHDASLHAPHLLDIEVLSALRRLTTSGQASLERATAAMDDLLDLPIERYAHHDLAPRIWDLRDNFSAYDAAYVALAEALSDDGVALLTGDSRLASAVAAHTELDVVVVANP